MQKLQLTQCHRFSWKLCAQIFSSPIHQCFPPSQVLCISMFTTSLSSSGIHFAFSGGRMLSPQQRSVLRNYGTRGVKIHEVSSQACWPAVDCFWLCVLSKRIQHGGGKCSMCLHLSLSFQLICWIYLFLGHCKAFGTHTCVSVSQKKSWHVSSR